MARLSPILAMVCASARPSARMGSASRVRAPGVAGAEFGFRRPLARIGGTAFAGATSRARGVRGWDAARWRAPCSNNCQRRARKADAIRECHQAEAAAEDQPDEAGRHRLPFGQPEEGGHPDVEAFGIDLRVMDETRSARQGRPAEHEADGQAVLSGSIRGERPAPCHRFARRQAVHLLARRRDRETDALQPSDRGETVSAGPRHADGARHGGVFGKFGRDRVPVFGGDERQAHHVQSRPAASAAAIPVRRPALRRWRSGWGRSGLGPPLGLARAKSGRLASAAALA